MLVASGLGIDDDASQYGEDVLQKPELRATEKQSEGSLNATDNTSLVLGASIGGRVFIVGALLVTPRDESRTTSDVPISRACSQVPVPYDEQVASNEELREVIISSRDQGDICEKREV